jgi:hypothetical protein
MSERAKGRFETTGFQEKPVQEAAGLPKLGRSSISLRLHGDLNGEAVSEGVLCYGEVRHKSASATFVTMDRFTGTLAGRQGSFVLQGCGSFDVATGAAACEWKVVEGSATGELEGLSGQGGYVAAQGQEFTYTLDYDFT